MSIGTSFLFGFIAAFIGTSLPGLINMTIVKIKDQNGIIRAIWFSTGATVVIFFQTLIAVLFAKFLNQRSDISNILQDIGFVLFVLLTVVFFWLEFKKDKKPLKIKEPIKLRSKSSRFFLGALVSALNLFPIPFYVFVSVSLASYHYFSYDLTDIYAFALGTAVAAFLVFYGYIVAFDRFEKKLNFISKNINIIIGSITALVAIISLINILKSK